MKRAVTEVNPYAIQLSQSSMYLGDSSDTSRGVIRGQRLMKAAFAVQPNVAVTIKSVAIPNR